MELFVVIVLFVLGLALIIWGGNLLVEGAEKISDITGISKVIIGATIVSFVTTLPEFLVTIFASARGSGEMAVGNAAGSMFFNFLIIAGLIFLLKPTKLKKDEFLSKTILLLVTTLTVFMFCLDKQISVVNSVVLLLIFALYLFLSFNEAKKSLKLKPEIYSVKVQASPKERRQKLFNTIFLIVIGGLMVAIGAKLMVDNGERLATLLGISAHIIGITIVSMGTSLPELVTGIISIKKNSSEISLGNILGANVINGTLLLGSAGIISGGTLLVKPDVSYIVMPLLLISILTMFLGVVLKKKSSRLFGGLMITCAIAYYCFIIFY